MAVNCCVLPATMEGAAGVTVIDDRTESATIRVAVPVTLPSVAAMVV